MLASISEEKYYGLHEFIRSIKDDWRFKQSLKEFISDFKKDLKEGCLTLISDIEIKSSDIDEFLGELEKNGINLDTELTTDEMVEYAERICENAKVYCEAIADEEGDLVVRIIHLNQFFPDAFENTAFLYWLNKEDVEETHGNLSNEKWQEFKELYEQADLPDSTFEAIKDFEYELVEKIKEESDVK